jgi:hypothetical protein
MRTHNSQTKFCLDPYEFYIFLFIGVYRGKDKNLSGKIGGSLQINSKQRGIMPHSTHGYSFPCGASLSLAGGYSPRRPITQPRANQVAS